MLLAGVARFGAGLLHGRAQHLAIALRRDRQAMLEVPAGEAAFVCVVAQLDLAALQRLAIGGAQDRQQHAAALAVGQLLPVDVEGAGMRRGRAPFQHVEPPGIVGEMHADMVGHEIEDQAEIVFAQRLGETRESGFAAELRIEAGVIDHVVAVRRALARLHEGRGVEMRDAERLQVGHDLGGLLEIEVGGQLQAIGRYRQGPRHRSASDAPEHRPGRQPVAGFAAPDRRAGRARRTIRDLLRR